MSSTPRLAVMSDSIVQKQAVSSANLNPLIAGRWSPRIYDPSHRLSQSELESLGEAFRWSPSSSNQQPWKLALISSGTELFESITTTGLTGFNQTWAPNASVMAVVMAAESFEGKARDKAATYFDVGLASSQLVTQAESMGLKAHFMGGIVPEAISEALRIQDHSVVCVIAIGKQGPITGQEPEIVTREQAPRTRKDAKDVYLIDSAF